VYTPIGVVVPMASADPLLAVQSSLTPRDHVLAGWLYDHGVLTTEQIAHALFPSLDFAQRRLVKLVRLQVIDRFRPQKPDGGSFPYHYVIDQLGADVAAAQRGEQRPRRDHARNRRHHLTSRANLPHLLGTNQFFIELAGYARTHPEAKLVRWWPAARFYDAGAFYEKGDNPQLMTRPLAMPRPDGHGVWVEHDRSCPFWLELDLGTEDQAVLVDKVYQYLYLDLHIKRRWPVLFSLPSSRRERNLHLRIAETLAAGVDRRLPAPAVATIARDRATAAGLSPAEAVWWLYGLPDRRLRLADLPDRISAMDKA
jgi:hypothetical protein